MDRFIVFDVETPNYKNDRISAIGITVVENGCIKESINTLVNPETFFSSFNVALTGITPSMVCDAPTFPELWSGLRKAFESGIPVAHNAPFDMGVLAKCLAFYNIDWKPYAEYICTVQMSRACFPVLPNHKLNTMCDYLGVELQHHNAGSDSEGCARVLLACLEQGATPNKYIRKYNMNRFKEF